MRDDRKNILITGGSGLIGTHLTRLLISEGYNVRHLGRSKKDGSIKTLIWDPKDFQIEKNVFKEIDVIVHLAGAGISDKRWDDKVKKEILFSRTQSTRLINETLSKEPHKVRVFVSASGINYYGLTSRGNALVEHDPPGKDFMAKVSEAWESEVDDLSVHQLRIVKMRTGVVFTSEGGALEKLAKPVRFLVGAPLGDGEQYVNWIHIDDLCRMYLKAIEDDAMTGAFNAIAPNPVTNHQLTKEIASVLDKPLWLPPVPSFAVKLIAGEVADVVLNGGKASAQKIVDSGFKFRFPSVRDALKDLLQKN